MSAKHGETGMRAIVVDDYQPFLAALTVLLSHKTGVEVVGQADNGNDGLKLIEELKPDLVMVDYTMPGIGGVEVTRRLKAMPGGPKVIVMSFQTEMECREQAFKAGADGFLVKTEMHQELLPLLRSVGA